jgi:hypothetical protein
MRFVASISFLLLIFLPACSKKTEEQQLEDFRDSLKYRTCKVASDKAVELAVSENNKKFSEKLTEKDVHGVLGVLCLASGKADLACIEADTITELNGGKPDTLSMSIRTVAYHKMEWPRLSQSEYDLLTAKVSKETGKKPSRITLEHKVTLVAYLLLGLYENQDEIAISSSQALGAICNLDYVEPLTRLIVDARHGRFVATGKDLNALKNSRQFARHRLAVEKEIEVLKHEGRDGKKDEALGRLSSVLIRGIISDIFSKAELKELMSKAGNVTKGAF